MEFWACLFEDWRTLNDFVVVCNSLLCFAKNRPNNFKKLRIGHFDYCLTNCQRFEKLLIQILNLCEFLTVGGLWIFTTSRARNFWLRSFRFTRIMAKQKQDREKWNFYAFQDHACLKLSTLQETPDSDFSKPQKCISNAFVHIYQQIENLIHFPKNVCRNYTC